MRPQKNLFISILLLTVLKNVDLVKYDKAKRKKHEQALFSLNEVDTTLQQGHSQKPVNQTDLWLLEIKENLIKAFGLRKSMLQTQNGDSKRRKPHNYMVYISKKYEKLYKDGIPTMADTVRGCADLGDQRKRLADFPHLAFKFDISEIPSSETLISSELKVLMKTPQRNSINSKALRNGMYKVTLFGVWPRKRKNNHGHIYPILAELHSKTIEVIKGQEYRWITFTASSFVPAIRGENKKYIKFVLRVKPLNGGTAVDPKLLGIDSYSTEETNKALLVLFSGGYDTVAKENSRKKRGITNVEKKSEKRRRKNKSNRRKGRRKGCRRKNMHVDFRDFGWTDWLFSPTTYNAYYCHGQCRYPVATHSKTSNHATIQSIIHSMNKNFIPPPCCVPTKFAPLPFLLLDGSDRIVFKFKDDVIVTECSCR